MFHVVTSDIKWFQQKQSVGLNILKGVEGLKRRRFAVRTPSEPEDQELHADPIPILSCPIPVPDPGSTLLRR